METFILAALGATFLWSIGNHIDNFLVSKLFKDAGVGALMIFSSLIVGIIMTPVFFFLSKGNVALDIISILWIFAAGTIYLLANWLFYKALEKNDTSVLIATFQSIPVFSYILGLIFLGETLTPKQVFASLVIVLASILVSVDFKEKSKKGFSKYYAMFLMLTCSVSYAISFFLFKFANQNSTFYVTAFWEEISFLVVGLLLYIFIKKFRNDFNYAIKTNGKKAFGLNISNEILNAIAKSLMNIATLGAPLAIAWTINCIQPFIVFGMGALITIFWPHLGGEDISKRAVIKKISCMLLATLGLIILYS